MWKNMRLSAWLLAIILVTLPVQQAWIRPLEQLGAPGWLLIALTAWSAPVLLLLAATTFARRRSWIAPDYLLGAFLLIAVLPVVWQPGSVAELVIGWRYTLLALVGYWIGRANIIPGEIVDRCLRGAVWVLLVGVGLQLGVWAIGNDWLINILGMEQAFAAGSWWRVFGFMSGPNQLGTFLAVAGVWLWWRRRLTAVEAFLIAVSVGLTVSRSALLGLMAGTLLVAIAVAPSGRQRLQRAAIVGAILLVVGAAIVSLQPLRASLVENRHSDLRVELLSDTAEHFRESSVGEWLVGHGSGTAGPAAAVINKGGFIPENWFLQIAYENGLGGLGLILAWFGSVLVIAVRQRNRVLAAILVAIGVNSLFLHPLSDNFAAALWFYLLVGTALGAGKSEENTVQYQQ